MTSRLYYNDPSSREFDATVVRVEVRNGRPAVWLDRSGFYPASGGQPFDTGSIGACTVVEVAEDEQGDVCHLLAPGGEPPGAGERVQGRIDWPRRFDHMQQHTGQHLLSAAFDRTCAAKTVSFHLGADTATIDLARPVTQDDIAAAEAETNRIVWEDRPVSIRYVSAEDAAALPLRKPSARTGTLRLIDVEGFDLSACGGTHVSRTGAVGLVAVTRWERFKGGQRIEFACGGRALTTFRVLRDANAAAVQRLSVLAGEVPGAIDRLQGDLKQLKRTAAAFETELARFRAVELAAGAEVHPLGRLVAQAVDADAAMLKAMALAVASQPGHLAVFVSSASPCLVAVARSSDVASDCSAVVKRLTADFGGRGGGRADFAQAGGLAAQSDAVLAAARNALTS